MLAGRELFFTRLTSGDPAIFRAARSDPSAAFGAGERIAAIDGFVEAPALSSDGRTLYYHRRDADNRYRIYRVRR